MSVNITEAMLRRLKKADKDIRDAKERGLVLRCRKSGRHTWRFQVRRGEWHTIGRLDAYALPEARKAAAELRGDLAKGKDPKAEKRIAAATSLAKFVEAEYKPWVEQHRKTGAETLERIETAFPAFADLPLKDVNGRRVEQWRTSRLADGVSAATINRDVNALRSVITRAVEFGFLQTHPLAKFKPLKLDSKGVVRYLSAAEERRLRKALEDRDEKRRSARVSANAWRRVRGYELRPALGAYSDHVTPLVLTALNTGLRRGELFGLQWADLDLDRGSLTVQGASAKSGETRHVPLNSEAARVLKAWRGPAEDRSGLVFAGAKGDERDDVKTAWRKIVKAAKLGDFRFHDLRHSFASKLVMAGVDLNTTRELLGHSDLKMTLKYAHLAPEVKAAAVEKLVNA